MEKRQSRFKRRANIKVVDVLTKAPVYDDHFDSSGYVVSETFNFGGREFRIDTSPTQEFIAFNDPKEHKFLLGILFAGIFFLANAFFSLILSFQLAVEKKVELKTKQLDENQRLLQYVLTATGSGIWDWNISSGKVSHNKRWLELLGLDNQQLVSTVEAYKQRIYPEDQAKVFEEINISMQTSQKYKMDYRMIRGDGSLIWVSDIGVVVERNSDGEPSRMVGAISDISNQKGVQEKIEALAFFDPVTNLPNRRFIEEKIVQAIEKCRINGSFSGLMLIDLDNFKFVNDTHGHHIGDILLKQFGMRLASVLGPEDLVSRIGGDEFLVLFDAHFTSLDGCIEGLKEVVNHICNQMTEAFKITRTTKVTIKPSIGVLNFGPDAQNFKELMTYVDLAMYSNKANRSQKYRFFDQSLLDEFKQRSDLSDGLIDACNSEQFYIDYQPVLNRDNEVVALEALVRWAHPSLGKLAPEKFIPFAEKNGQIKIVGNAIFDKIFSSTDVARLRKGDKVFSLMVNVSGLHLMDSDFADEFISMAKNYHFPLSLIVIEVTESVFLYDKEQSILTMEALIDEGVQFALDDFGTGYSSFSYLQKLPVKFLKIDKTFVAGLDHDDSRLIVRNIINLAHALNLKVIAEGVEDEGQYELLYAMSCDYFQGWYCGRPAPLPPIQ